MSRLLKSMMIFTAFAFAVTAADKCVDDDQSLKGYDQGHVVKEHQMLGAYNAPARIDVRGSFDVFLQADFIWWQPKEEGTELASVIKNPQALATPDSTVHIGNDYKPGFKIGLGVNFEHDNWGMFTEYTWLHFTQSTSYTKSVATDSVYPIWNHTLGAVDSLTGNWKVGYDVIDLVMQRAYYNGTKLTYTPYLGLRGGWLKQKISTTGTIGANTAPSTAKDKTWLIGPKAGFDANYIFGAGFRMFGKAAAALLYQNFKTSINYYSAAATPVLQKYKKDSNGQITPNAELGLGLGYGTYFSNRGFHFDIAISYDFEYFWKQNRMISILEYDDSSAQGDLFMHGLTVALRFDF